MVTLGDMQMASTTNNLRERIEQVLLADREFGQIYGLLTSSTYDQATSEFRFTLLSKIIYYIVCLNQALSLDKSIRALWVHEHHDGPFCGHMGINRTYLSLSKD